MRKIDVGKIQWRNMKYSFFKHSECEAFPCHDIENKNEFNCLFCYCPLYAFGESCGGNYVLTSRGVMDCSNCVLPHERENYGYIIQKCEDVNDTINRVKEIKIMRGE